jgi:hypothetical protein
MLTQPYEVGLKIRIQDIICFGFTDKIVFKKLKELIDSKTIQANYAMYFGLLR